MLKDTDAPARLAGNMLTIPEAGKEARLCRSTIYALMDSGHLQSVRIPGCRARRIPRQAIEQLLANGLTGGQT